MRHLAWPVISLFTCLLSAPLQAQTSDDIERISVTATKLPLSIQQTAASIQAVQSDWLKTVNAQHISQALMQNPGTWVSRGNGQEHLSAIRSPVLTGAGACGAFFMALDGISLRASGFCNTNQLFDANSEQATSIEVLRGPASVLYGSNAMHGVINIITPNVFSEGRNALAVDIGANQYVRSKLSLNAHDDNQGFSLLINATDDGGYQDESGYVQQKATLIYQYAGQDWQNKTVFDMANLAQETAGFIQGFEAYKDANLVRTNPNPEAFRDAQSLRAYSSFTRQFNNSEIRITPYLRWNDMAFLQHYLPWKALEQNSHHSIGLQSLYRHDLDAVTLLVGVDVDNTQASLNESQDNAFSDTIPAGQHYDYDVQAQTLAMYSQAVWQVNAWQWTVGARLEHIAYDYENLLSDGSACAENVDNCRFTRPADRKDSFVAFSPSIHASYRLSDQQFLYAALSQGYRAPQATELYRLQNGQAVSDLDTENMRALELGWRFNSANTQLHAAVYAMQKRDVIFQDSNRQNISGGQTSHQGVELSAKYQINPALDVSAQLSLADHTYDNDIQISRQSIRGNTIDTAPKQMANISLNWHINESLHSSMNINKLGSYYLNPENTQSYAGHTLLDWHLKYQLNPQVQIKASVFNLTDKAYAERADFGFGNLRYFVGQPRRLFLHVKWDWTAL